MASSELRLKVVEDRVMEHSQAFIDLRQSLGQFEARVDRRFELLDRRLTALDQKVGAMGARLDQKIDGLGLRLDEKIDAMGLRLEGKVDALTGELTKHFHWTAGLMLTGLIAIAAAILAS